MLAPLGEFGEHSNVALCDQLFCRLLDAHKNNVDADSLSEEERILYLVWGAFGVMSNGGFRYLFELGPVRGDPYFARTSRAFETIGCPEAAKALDRTLALFANSQPPLDAGERLRAYNSRIRSWPTPEESQFLQAADRIASCLANYVRSRQAAFEHFA